MSGRRCNDCGEMVAMCDAVAVYDPATGHALGVFRDPADAAMFLGALDPRRRARVTAAPWLVPAEIFEAE